MSVPRKGESFPLLFYVLTLGDVLTLANLEVYLDFLSIGAFYDLTTLVVRGRLRLISLDP